MLDSVNDFLTTALGQYNKDQDRKAQLERDLRPFNENPYYGVDEYGMIYKRGVQAAPAQTVGVSNTLLVGGAVVALLAVVLIART